MSDEQNRPQDAHPGAAGETTGSGPQESGASQNPPRSDSGTPIAPPPAESGDTPPHSETTHSETPQGDATASGWTQSASQSSTGQAGAGQSATQRTTQAAREQAGVAAGALRRGEFMQDATVDDSASSDDRLIALLSYVTQVFIPVVMPLIVLLSESSKNRPFQRYHAVQSLALTLLFVLVAVAASLGGVIIQIIPLVGQLVSLLLFCLSPIAYLMAVIAMFYYGYQSYQGKRFAIPGLTTFLRDQGWLS